MTYYSRISKQQTLINCMQIYKIRSMQKQLKTNLLNWELKKSEFVFSI